SFTKCRNRIIQMPKDMAENGDAECAVWKRQRVRTPHQRAGSKIRARDENEPDRRKGYINTVILLSEVHGVQHAEDRAGSAADLDKGDRFYLLTHPDDVLRFLPGS